MGELFAPKEKARLPSHESRWSDVKSSKYKSSTLYSLIGKKCKDTSSLRKTRRYKNSTPTPRPIQNGPQTTRSAAEVGDKEPDTFKEGARTMQVLPRIKRRTVAASTRSVDRVMQRSQANQGWVKQPLHIRELRLTAGAEQAKDRLGAFELLNYFSQRTAPVPFK